ncbi:M14 family metallopeptidase [Erythrobacter sp.]|uniref:M14 family metallopeptidase n=1 Tax=Erythrobacter sp. TaxID=1042 RepID=UPI0025DCA374|nr:M14 family metallopeptidase [Erythrobacter sp.]
MRAARWQCAALLALAVAKGAGAHAPPPEPPLGDEAPAVSPDCRTAAASLHFDFAGAAPSACAITGERDFTLLVTPEHAPPINPSPWYAFRYEADEGGPITVTLRYLAGQHRYAPKLAMGDGEWRELPAEPTPDGKGVVLRLPAGKGSVSAQERIIPGDASADLARWSGLAGAQPFQLGQSHDGRPIEAIRIGRADAPRLVVLLGRQHPPEVTGAIAMRAFVDALVEARARAQQDFADLQFLIVPMLNPDGVARGHWRANRGAQDLNRDWGAFTQPETRSVKTWLDALPAGVRPVLMVDFHSTRSNLFYVQGPDEASAAQQRFLAAWLEAREAEVPGYSFSIEPRNANPGSGTAKNWFHDAYGIPAYTYEVADEADRAATRAAAGLLAQTLPEALTALAD